VKPIFAVCLLVSLGFAVSAWGADPFVGTWKLNIGKTKVITGLSPKEGTITKRLEGDHYIVTESNTFGNGTHVAVRSIEPIDGGKIKYEQGRSESTDIVKRLNRNTREYTRTRGGKVVLTEQLIISKDGASMTDRAKGTNAQGEPFDRIEVWEKQ
jgi:hypothetical protein